MKQLKSSVTVCCFLLLGCSKKEEECAAVMSAAQSKTAAALNLEIDVAADKGADTLLKDAVAVNKCAEAVTRSVAELNGLSLTDEKLIALRGALAASLVEVKTLMLEWAESAAAGAKAGTPDVDVGKLLTDAKGEAADYCNKKPRRRRARKKRKKVCRPVAPLIAEISLDGLDPQTLPLKRDALESLSISDKNLATPVARIVDTLDEIEKGFAIDENIRAKYKGYNDKFSKLKQAIEKTAADMKGYCAAK